MAAGRVAFSSRGHAPTGLRQRGGVGAVMDPAAYDDLLLVGSLYHGFNRGRHLRLSATQGFEERRWLNNEETSAMMLNPQIFRNPHGVLLDDQAFTVDCYSLLVDMDEYNGMMAHSGPRAQQQQFWPYYGSVDHHNPMKREYFAGMSKNHAAHRGSDNEEIICKKYEVKGAYRCRRRTILPDNLFAVTGIHPPFPNMMVLQYQLTPDALVANRLHQADLMAIHVQQRRDELGEGLIPLYGGPARPPGLL